MPRPVGQLRGEDVLVGRSRTSACWATTWRTSTTAPRRWWWRSTGSRRGWVETLRVKYAFFKHPTERDLVYYEGSPNFCEPNTETGSFGTRDRVCNVSSHGIEGCDLLCCGRGHNTRTEKRKEKCHCIFHWCCYVSCQECVRVYDVHTCKWEEASGKRDCWTSSAAPPVPCPPSQRQLPSFSRHAHRNTLNSYTFNPPPPPPVHTNADI